MVECIERLLHLFHKNYQVDESDHKHLSLLQSGLKASKVFGSSRNKLVDQFLELKVSPRTHRQESLPVCGLVFDGISPAEEVDTQSDLSKNANQLSDGHQSSMMRSEVVSPGVATSLASRIHHD